MKQSIINGSAFAVEEIIKKLNIKKYLLVCGKSLKLMPINDYLDKISVPYVRFSDFSPNPLYRDVCSGVDLFKRENCDAIIAIGGGSAIDVAKCIKLFSPMDSEKNYLTQEFTDSKIPLVAIPTTAGTGSESTRFAVIYYSGQKQSVAHESIVPDYAVLDEGLLKTLPTYQKKCAMLDALCQGIESWWSVNATDESIQYSQNAVKMIIENMDAYIFENSAQAAKQIILASNYAGRAINITETTAPHAMSYKLTSMYNLPHGHAVAVCLPHVWRYMTNNLDKQIHPQGAEHLKGIFEKISSTIGVENIDGAVDKFKEILNKLQIEYPKANCLSDVDILVHSVNVQRLSNNPIFLSKAVLRDIYCNILNLNK